MHPLDKFKYCPSCGSETFNPSGSKAALCMDCGFKYYMNPSSAVACFITDNKGNILVARRKKEPAKGSLDLPGGFCDLGETLEQAALREVLEETGLSLTRPIYLFSIPNLYEYSGLIVHTMDAFFELSFDSSQPFEANDDVDSLELLPISFLQPNEFGLSSIKEAIKRYCEMYQKNLSS